MRARWGVFSEPEASVVGRAGTSELMAGDAGDGLPVAANWYSPPFDWIYHAPDGVRNRPGPPKTGRRIRSSESVRPGTLHRRGWVGHPPSSEARHSPPHFSIQPLAFSLAPSPPSSSRLTGRRAILAFR